MCVSGKVVLFSLDGLRLGVFLCLLPVSELVLVGVLSSASIAVAALDTIGKKGWFSFSRMI